MGAVAGTRVDKYNLRISAGKYKVLVSSQIVGQAGKNKFGQGQLNGTRGQGRDWGQVQGWRPSKVRGAGKSKDPLTDTCEKVNLH